MLKKMFSVCVCLCDFTQWGPIEWQQPLCHVQACGFWEDEFKDISRNFLLFFSLHTMEGNDHHNHLVTSILQSVLQKNKKVKQVCKDMKGSKLGELFLITLAFFYTDGNWNQHITPKV